MASTYTLNTGIEKPGTGEQSGTWGNTTNTNFDIIDRALSGVGAISLTGTTTTLTTTDGSLTDGMYKVLVLGGSPSGTNTITIGDNTQDKVYFVVNNSGQEVIFTQGTGANATIANGAADIIYADGAGSGAAVASFFGTALKVGTDLTIGGDSTFSGDTHTFSSANSTDPLLIIKNTTNDANGSRLHFVKDKGAAGADGDDIGTIEFISDDDGQNQTSFAKIVAEVSESANTDEAGKLSFFVAESDGTNTALTAGLILEGEHATDGEVDVTIGAGAGSTTSVAGDLSLAHDGAILNFGADNDVTLTHVHDTGLLLNTNLNVTRSDNGDNLTLISTDADAGGGPALSFYRNSSSPADDDTMCTIRFEGNNDNSQLVIYGKIRADIADASDGSEDGTLHVFNMVAGTERAMLSIKPTEVVFNEEARNCSFRVESENDANSLLVSGDVGNVGIGHNNPLHALDIKKAAPELMLEETSSGGSKRIGLAVTSGGQPQITAEQSGGSIEFNLTEVVNTKIHQYRVNIGTSPSKDSTAADIADGSTTQGAIFGGQDSVLAVNGQFVLECNRTGSDGSVVLFKQAGTTEGSVSISGSTTSYNAFTGSHWSRLTDNSKPTLLRGTVVESIDDMMDWYHLEFTKPELKYQDGDDIPKGKKVGDVSREEFDLKKDYDKPSDVNVGDTVKYKDEDGIEYDAKVVLTDDVKHVKCKISDTADCTNVYGVFMDWDNDDDCYNDMYVNAVGTSLVRIQKDQTITKGDLLTSNGDGTAKKQDDDIIRSKTIGKVLTNIKQETYSDGSYTVPCALYCG